MIPGVMALIASLTAVASYLRYRDALYPPVIHSTLWTVLIVAYSLSGDRFHELPIETYALIIGGVLAFAAGSYVTTVDFKFDARQTPPRISAARYGFGDVLLVTTIAGLPVVVATILDLAAGGSVDNPFVNARRALSGDSFAELPASADLGLLSYLFPMSLMSLGIQFFHRAEAKWRFRCAVVVATCYGLLTTGRTYLLWEICLLVGLFLISRRVSVRTGGLALAVLAPIMFIGLGVAYEKVGEGTLEAIVSSFLLYLLGGLAAFGQHMNADLSPEWGVNTFRTIFAALSRIGFDVSVPSLVRPYEFLPEPINVYTVYQPYFDDLGYFGAMLAALLFGGLHGWVYRRATLGTPAFVLAYALLLYPLITQFFQDQYFSLLSIWVQCLVILIVAFAGKRPSLRALHVRRA